MSICGHMLVRNEEKYIWFSAMSVLDHIDKLKLWVMESEDNTYEIASLIKQTSPRKVELKKIPSADINEFTQVRQSMLKKTKEDWVLIIDGDEVWWNQAIKNLAVTISKNGKKLESIVTHYLNVIGDIYHFQEEKASHYSIDDSKGAITIRAMNRDIPGLNISKPHGTQGFYDKDGRLIQERDKLKRLHINEVAYLHFTHLPRGGNKKSDSLVPKRAFKYKYEIGTSFPSDYFYPEVFFKPKPDIVLSPWVSMNTAYAIQSSLLTPLRKIKRRAVKLPIGY